MKIPVIRLQFQSFDIFTGVAKKSLKSTVSETLKFDRERNLETWTKYQQMVNFSCTNRSEIPTVHGVRTTNTHHGIITFSPMQIFERENPELRN